MLLSKKFNGLLNFCNYGFLLLNNLRLVEAAV